VKAVKGTSNDTGRMVTVDRLEAGFPESHLLLGVCRNRPLATYRGKEHSSMGETSWVVNTDKIQEQHTHTFPMAHTCFECTLTCQGSVNLLHIPQDFLTQQMDESGHYLWIPPLDGAEGPFGQLG
jgi:hypothetical protein